ncbi:hypothetical protein OIU34_23745 [Pararhizobium sp. BT-229]|uniref:hypothetical protein n=1 Tax=Pararhizobium sp. BT-229 TaxID=2986923 RepID=UPI0021F718D7|nr:hypothetical protein [Pararhizobium sp. BT-229]MCV9964911.1 hypothetical protein [Pararhizobium sp. BT-229]
MCNERETKWLRIGDADVCLLHDVCGFESEIEVTFDDGKSVGFPVPVIDKAGLPSDAGEPPTLAELERLGTLLATYSRPLGELGVDGKCRIALEMNSDLVADSPGFAWLALLKEAEDCGIHIGFDRSPAPCVSMKA